MKIKFNLLILVTIFFYACEIEGVKNNTPEISHNDSLNISLVDSNTTQVKQTVLLQSDTLPGGIQNEMVWQDKTGLRIEWDKKTTEPKLNYGDVVMVNYTARVARGEVYDNNNEIGHPVPIKIGIGTLIEGWEKGLLQMHPGDKGKIMIPSKLAYGENGLGTIVPVNADIIVEIEIVEKIEPENLEDGVKVYKYESVNSGQTPLKNQMVTFDYFAFRTGKKPGLYDNSYEKGTPFTFRFKNDNIIDGLHIGMAVLKEGEKAFIEIPSKVAYGSAGIVDLLPPNTDIVYDVRVEKIE